MASVMLPSGSESEAEAAVMAIRFFRVTPPMRRGRTGGGKTSLLSFLFFGFFDFRFGVRFCLRGCGFFGLGFLLLFLRGLFFGLSLFAAALLFLFPEEVEILRGHHVGPLGVQDIGADVFGQLFVVGVDDDEVGFRRRTNSSALPQASAW